MIDDRLGFYEFFAGGGMARLGLGKRWRCLMANEFSPKKAEAYRDNHDPCPELLVEDVASLTPANLPPGAALAWASFPCQDLSLAGLGPWPERQAEWYVLAILATHGGAGG